MSNSSTLPPPTVPSSSPSPSAHFLSSPHLFTRFLYHVLPLPVQHYLRDHGFLRLTDAPAALAGLLLILPTRPSLLTLFLSPPPTVHRNLRYSPHPSHLLDLYLPLSPPSTHPSSLSPILLMCHGGAWGSGNRQMYSLVGHCLSRHCHAVTVIHSYRTYPDADARGQADDLHTALTWVREHAHEWGGDVSKIFLVGHSSGAHVASLLLLSPTPPTPPPAFHPFAAPSPPAPPPVAGFIGLSGVYDIASHYEYEARRGVHEVSPMKPANGGLDGFDDHSPAVKQREGGSEGDTVLGTGRGEEGGWRGRMLLVHGDADKTVPDEQSRRVAEARGGRVWWTGTRIDGREVGGEEGEGGWAQGDGCVCVVYREEDHASTVLSLMLQTGSHLIATIRAFVEGVGDEVERASEARTRAAACDPLQSSSAPVGLQSRL